MALIIRELYVATTITVEPREIRLVVNEMVIKRPRFTSFLLDEVIETIIKRVNRSKCQVVEVK